MIGNRLADIQTRVLSKIGQYWVGQLWRINNGLQLE